MHKTKYKSSHHSSHHDLYDDWDHIKKALFDTASDVKGKSGDMIQQSFDNIKEKSSEIKNNISDYTTEKPLKSLGITFLIGIVVGYLIHK